MSTLRKETLETAGLVLILLLILLLAASCASAPAPLPEAKAPKVEAPEIDEAMKKSAQTGDSEKTEESAEEKKAGKEEVEEEDSSLLLDLSAAKRQRLSSLLDRSLFLVYTGRSDLSDLTEFELELAVEEANSYLAERGYSYVAYEQLRQLMKGRMERYEEETGGRIPPITWSAETFDADIYVDMRVEAKSSMEEGNHFATSAVSLLFIRRTTGKQWAESSSSSTTAVMSSKSREDALRSSIGRTVRRAMTDGIEEFRKNGARILAEGLPYTIVIESTNDEELLRNFVKSFKKRVESIDRVKSSVEETSFELRFIGDVTELEEAVLKTAEETEGFEEMFLVYQRGNTITFNTGI